MTTILEVRDLIIERGGRPILLVEHLQVEQGEVLALVGPNGAGKTTLLLALCRLIKGSGGQIGWRDQEMGRQERRDFRRNIALVLQTPQLLDRTVFENVAVGMRFRGLPRAEIDKRASYWLDRLGIAELRLRRARSLSGGEAQRVSLGRAFALQPQIILLDEPFSALDAPTRSQLLLDFQILLRETGQTAIFVTHDLEEALMLGDRMAVILDGKICQVDRPEQVLSAPADPQVAAFVGVETIIPGRVASGEAGLLQVKIDGFQIEALGDLQPGREIFVCLRPEDLTIWNQVNLPASSARNRLRGKIIRLIPHGVLVRVTIDCGFPVVALITRASAQEMGLQPDQQVAVSFKASAIHLIPR